MVSRRFFVALWVVAAGPWPAVAGPFPVRVSENGRHLVDADGKPWLYHADTGWQVFSRLTLKEADEYFADRVTFGFTAIQTQLAPPKPDGKKPDGTNRAGVAPFRDANDFTTINEDYFKHADAVIADAAKRGLLLAVNPVWLADYKEQYKANGPDGCRAYGKWLGARYKGAANVIWVVGGDAAWGTHTPLVRAMAEGLRAGGAKQLITAHVDTPNSAEDRYPGAKWLDLNSTYTYAPDYRWGPYHVYARCLRDYHREKPKPFVLIESYYEDEHEAKPQWIRRQAYWSLLSGACGQAVGSRTYLFKPDWKERLDSVGYRSMKHLKGLFDRFAWWELVPDDKAEWLTDGRGRFNGGTDRTGYDYVAAARGKEFALAYLPTPRAVTVDASKLGWSRVKAVWFDPRGGGSVPAGTLAGTGTHRFAPPGEDDWVLVLTAGR
jgi:hypothetical protein